MNAGRSLVFVLCSAGCVNEYHPEYHPVSIVTVNQIAPLVEVQPPQDHHKLAEHVAVETAALPTYGARDGGAEPDYEALFTRDAGDPFAISEARPFYASAEPRTLIGRGVYIGGNVQFHGNVTINGDVYIDARKH